MTEKNSTEAVADLHGEAAAVHQSAPHQDAPPQVGLVVAHHTESAAAHHGEPAAVHQSAPHQDAPPQVGLVVAHHAESAAAHHGEPAAVHQSAPHQDAPPQVGLVVAHHSEPAAVHQDAPPQVGLVVSHHSEPAAVHQDAPPQVAQVVEHHGEPAISHPAEPTADSQTQPSSPKGDHHQDLHKEPIDEVEVEGQRDKDKESNAAASTEDGTKNKGGSPLLPGGSPPSDIQDAEGDEKNLKYPKSVFFIIGNEFCERFTYYGMRTILSLYLINSIKMSEEDATVTYHVFAMLSYFFPVLGAVIADSWLGKFNTIAYLSVVYAIGNIVVACSALPNLHSESMWMAFLGLVLIAVGAGGIKPCVAAFGGDQFVMPQQQRHLASFFSVFYFAINTGSLISTYLTPELRALPCLGEETCYSLAFGIPSILMVVALVIFVVGKPGYKILKPKGNVLVDVFKCMWSAFKNKVSSKEKKEHWLEHADSRFDEKLRTDIRAMLRVLLLFVPLPIFWALYDQQGSRWTFQANNMNGRIGSWVVKPDQMQVVNPLLILLFLPLFETVVYPLLNKVRLCRTPLQKLGAGGILAAVAFVISAILELQLQQYYPVSLSDGLAQVRVFNGLPCPVTLNGGQEIPDMETTLNRMAFWERTDIAAVGSKIVTLNISGTCVPYGQELDLDLEEKRSFSFLLYPDGPNGTIETLRFKDELEKDSNPRLRVFYYIPGGKTVSMQLLHGDKEKSSQSLTGSGALVISPSVDPAEYTIKLGGKVVGDAHLFDVGGVYTVLVVDSDVAVHTTIQPNIVNLFWLLPQYVVITVSEVMFSVTGLEFSFTQAPVSMKSVLMSAWQLTVAIGNLIVVLITEIRFFDSQANEFFLFAALMLAVMLIFIWLATRYEYVEYKSEDEQPPAQPLGVINSKPSENGTDKDHKS